MVSSPKRQQVNVAFWVSNEGVNSSIKILYSFTEER